jgi:hypothetical protein
MELPERFKNREGPRRAIAGSVVAGLSGGSVPSLSIAGNAFTLIDSNGEQEAVETKYIDVVVMDVNERVPVQRVFFGVGAKYDANNPSGPICFSDNGIGASSNAREPQSDNCRSCPMAQWDSSVSAMTGKGVPACKVIKKLAVLPLDGVQRLYDFPFQLRVPVMSHAALQAYGNKFEQVEARGKFDVSDVVTRISFAHGKVGQLEFEVRKESPWVTDELDSFIDRLLDSKITDAMVGRNDVPVQGKIAPPAQPAPRQIEAKPSPIQTRTAATTPVDGTPLGGVGVDSPPAPRTRTRRLASKPAEVAAAPPPEEAKPAPVATARPLPSFLQPKGESPPKENGSTLTRQPAASDTAPPSELQAALEAAFNLKV